MEEMTITELYHECRKMIEKGKGNKKIMISDDDEGNGYHSLFFAFSKVDDDLLYMSTLPYGVDGKKAKEEYIVLG